MLWDSLFALALALPLLPLALLALRARSVTRRLAVLKARPRGRRAHDAGAASEELLATLRQQHGVDSPPAERRRECQRAVRALPARTQRRRHRGRRGGRSRSSTPSCPSRASGTTAVANRSVHALWGGMHARRRARHAPAQDAQSLQYLAERGLLAAAGGAAGAAVGDSHRRARLAPAPSDAARDGRAAGHGEHRRHALSRAASRNRRRQRARSCSRCAAPTPRATCCSR